MDITRRRFLINTGLTLSAVTIPGIISSSKRKVINQYNDWKGFTSSEIDELNKYNLDNILATLIPMLLFASAIDITPIIMILLILISHNIYFLNFAIV